MYFTSEAFMYIKRVAVEVAFHYSVEHVERRKRIRELAHEQKLKLTIVKLDIGESGDKMQEKAVYHICAVSEQVFHLLRGAV